MTTDEATRIVVLIGAAFPSTELSVDTVKLYLAHLAPLPFERSWDGVRLMLLKATFPPRLSELMEACGVSDDDTRRELLKAVAEGGHLERDIRSVTGWRYVAPGLSAPATEPVALPSPNRRGGRVRPVRELVRLPGYLPNRPPWRDAPSSNATETREPVTQEV